MLVHQSPENVLIIGGGDGAVIGEVLKHKSVKRVVLVEIDKMVVDASKQFFPQFNPWTDPRLTVHFADGAKYLTEHVGEFDVIIVDSSDPVGASLEFLRIAHCLFVSLACCPLCPQSLTLCRLDRVWRMR